MVSRQHITIYGGEIPAIGGGQDKRVSDKCRYLIVIELFFCPTPTLTVGHIRY
jgi:hypothetical protein